MVSATFFSYAGREAGWVSRGWLPMVSATLFSYAGREARVQDSQEESRFSKQETLA